MALKLVNPPFAGGYSYEIKSLFASVEQQIGEEWPDPAKVGPLVSDHMNTFKVNAARQKLNAIRRSIDLAMRHEREGRVGDALSTWRNQVFGEFFPLS